MQSSLKINRVRIEMRKLKISLLILLCSMFFTNGVIAQNKPLACQVEEAAGLQWANGRWTSSLFNTQKFILVQVGNTLTIESVAKVFNNTLPSSITCRYNAPETTCFDVAGRVIYFNPQVLKGATSRLFGGTMGGATRDSVAVEVFSCTPF